MYKRFILIVSAAVLSVCCSREEPEALVVPGAVQRSFEASLETPDVSRTALLPGGSVVCSGGDRRVIKIMGMILCLITPG